MKKENEHTDNFSNICNVEDELTEESDASPFFSNTEFSQVNILAGRRSVCYWLPKPGQQHLESF